MQIRAVTALVLILVPALAAARKDYELWDNLKELQSGHKIEIVDSKFKSQKGNFGGFSENAISLQVQNHEVVVQRPNVLRVSSREKNRRKRHILIGAVIGAAAMGALSVGCQAIGSEGGNVAACVASEVAAGAAIGAGLGALAPGYLTIYQARKVKAQKSGERTTGK